jgi:hypothetical protein
LRSLALNVGFEIRHVTLSLIAASTKRPMLSLDDSDEERTTKRTKGRTSFDKPYHSRLFENQPEFPSGSAECDSDEEVSLALPFPWSESVRVVFVVDGQRV